VLRRVIGRSSDCHSADSIPHPLPGHSRGAVRSSSTRTDIVSFLFLIFNCIDFDENFLHSDKKRLKFLLSYLERFSSLKKTKENYLLYKYYHEILNFRLGNIEDALNESFGIMAVIEEDKGEMSKFIEFIKLKNELFQVKLNEANNDNAQLGENYNLIKDIYEKVKIQNPFLALKLGFMLFNNLYNQNLYKECISILYQMNLIIKFI